MDYKKSEYFKKVYRKLTGKYQTLTNELDKELRTLLNEAFWKIENFQVASRIKEPQSAISKLETKGIDFFLDDDENLSNIIEKNIEDIAGFRIIVTRKTDVDRVASALLSKVKENRKWIVKESIGYTEDTLEAERWSDLGIQKILTREGGYSGLHVILAAPADKTFICVELQIRTRLQDAWYGIEHPLYKCRESLGSEITGMRQGLARIVDGLGMSYEKISDAGFEKLKTNTTELDDIPLALVPWFSLFKTPKDCEGKLIAVEGLHSMAFIPINSNKIAWSDDLDFIKATLGDSWYEKAIKMPLLFLFGQYDADVSLATYVTDNPSNPIWTGNISKEAPIARPILLEGPPRP